MSSAPTVPAHLAPVEVERELLAAAFRASEILDQHPDHERADRALTAVVQLPSADLCQEEHRQIRDAIAHVIGRTGGCSPALVLQVLRERRQMDAIRLLLSICAGAWAPISLVDALVTQVREAARLRREYWAATARAAQILEGPNGG
jgi:hypothetical protein